MPAKKPSQLPWHIYPLSCSPRPNHPVLSLALQQNTNCNLPLPLSTSVGPQNHPFLTSLLTCYFVPDFNSNRQILLTQGQLLPGQQVSWRQNHTSPKLLRSNPPDLIQSSEARSLPSSPFPLWSNPQRITRQGLLPTFLHPTHPTQ